MEWDGRGKLGYGYACMRVCGVVVGFHDCMAFALDSYTKA
jgi:hypothetical protein